MITIIKEGNKIVCSNDTYETMYKRLGYEILAENKKTEVKKTEGLEDTKNEKIVIPETTKEKGIRGRAKKGE